MNIDAKTARTAKCSELKKGDQVVYKIREGGQEDYWHGTVMLVTPENRMVHACRLEGYRNRDDAVPFEDLAAKYDPDGEEMRFGCVHGPSVILIPS